VTKPLGLGVRGLVYMIMSLLWKGLGVGEEEMLEVSRRG
jgi:hypothetical protein